MLHAGGARMKWKLLRPGPDRHVQIPAVRCVQTPLSVDGSNYVWTAAGGAALGTQSDNYKTMQGAWLVEGI